MKRAETCHFWVGHFPKRIAETYFVEVRGEVDEDGEDRPISPFARDQSVQYYDHDFLEYGWGKARSIIELVKGYSYSDQWGEELSQRAAAAGLKDVNFFVFITESEVENPRSVKGKGYWLHYVGTITYRI